MRARNIKPGFFKNEVLAKLEPLDRLLFIGLWCLADREGRLENRPERIKVEVLPWDKLDTAKAIARLEAVGFLHCYSIDNSKFIQVRNFDKHQNPHLRESSSTIPPARAVPRHGLGSAKAVPRHGRAHLNPSSLNPESPFSDSMPPRGGFDILWNKYPRREGRKAAERHYKASVTTTKEWLDIQNALDHYLKHIRTNKTEMQFIKHGSTWFNNWQDWINYTEDDNGRHGTERVFGDDAFTQRVIEAQGLRKADFEGRAGKILARVRDSPVDAKKSDPADRDADIENGEPVE